MSVRLPLTFQQEWLWDAIRANESWQCVSVHAFRLPDPLDVPLLQECLHDVVGRHDSLRTRICVEDGVVWQEMRDFERDALEMITVEGDCDARRHFEEVCDRKMNVLFEPLWNARLLRLSEHEHWLVLAMHRLIGDCASIEQTYRETKSLYCERLESRSPSEEKPPAQYSHYALEQRRTAAEWARKHEPHWIRRLTGATPLQWPVDPDLTVALPGVLGKVQCSFGQALSSELLELARSVRTLPAVPMMSVYAAVLWRWCQQEDFVLPLNTAGRPTEYKSTIGYFSCALYLRVQITGNETFRELVSRVGNEFFSSLAHQDFGRMARQRPELLSGTLFQWMTWHPEEQPDEVRIREFGEGMTIVPPGMTGLEVTVFDTATGLHAFGSYRADRFTADRMERFMADLVWAAELFARDPDARVAAVAEARGDAHGTAKRRRVSAR